MIQLDIVIDLSVKAADGVIKRTKSMARIMTCDDRATILNQL